MSGEQFTQHFCGEDKRLAGEPGPSAAAKAVSKGKAAPAKKAAAKKVAAKKVAGKKKPKATAKPAKKMKATAKKGR